MNTAIEPTFAFSEPAREQFRQNLPPGNAVLSLVSHDRQAVRNVIEAVGAYPEEYFKLLTLVGPDDRVALFEHQNHLQLWERIANARDSQTGQLAASVVASLGENNVRALVQSLVAYPNYSTMEFEVMCRATSAVKIASALPLPDVAKTIPPFVKILEKIAKHSDIDDLVRVALNTVGITTYRPNLSGDDRIQVAQAIDSLATIRTNSTNIEGLDTYASLIREKADEKYGDKKIVLSIDNLMEHFGYTWKSQPTPGYKMSI